eukprot:EG_transcript_3964
MPIQEHDRRRSVSSLRTGSSERATSFVPLSSRAGSRPTTKEASPHPSRRAVSEHAKESVNAGAVRLKSHEKEKEKEREKEPSRRPLKERADASKAAPVDAWQWASRIADLQREVASLRALERVRRQEQSEWKAEAEALRSRERQLGQEVVQLRSDLRALNPPAGPLDLNGEVKPLFPQPPPICSIFDPDRPKFRGSSTSAVVKGYDKRGVAPLEQRSSSRPRSGPPREDGLLDPEPAKDQLIAELRLQLGQLKGEKAALQGRLGEMLRSYMDVMDDRFRQEDSSQRANARSPSCRSVRTDASCEAEEVQGLLDREASLRAEIDGLHVKVSHLQTVVSRYERGAGADDAMHDGGLGDDAGTLREELWCRTKALGHAAERCRALERQVAELQQRMKDEAADAEAIAQELQAEYSAKVSQLEATVEALGSRMETQQREAMEEKLTLKSVIAQLRSLLQDAHRQLALQSLPNPTPATNGYVPPILPAEEIPSGHLPARHRADEEEFQLIYSRNNPQLLSDNASAEMEYSHSGTIQPAAVEYCESPLEDIEVEDEEGFPRGEEEEDEFVPESPAEPADADQLSPDPRTASPPLLMDTHIYPDEDLEFIHCRPPPRIDAVEEEPVSIGSLKPDYASSSAMPAAEGDFQLIYSRFQNVADFS